MAPASSSSSASRARPSAQQGPVAPRQAVRDDRIAQAWHRTHRATPLAGDRRVVHGEAAPVLDRRAEAVPRVAEGEGGEAGPGRRAAEGEVRCELRDLLDRDVVADVDLTGEARRQLHRGVDGEGATDVVPQPGALQERRRLDGATGDDDVGEVDGAGLPAGRGDLGAHRPPAIEDEAVDAGVREQPGAGRGRPRQVGLGHAAAPPGRGIPPVRVGHPPGDLVVAPAESGRAAAQGLAGGRVGAGDGLHGQLVLDLVADGVEVGGVEVDETGGRRASA